MIYYYQISDNIKIISKKVKNSQKSSLLTGFMTKTLKLYVSMYKHLVTTKKCTKRSMIFMK